MWTRGFSRTAVRFWSILGTDKIRVGCFFFLIFCCGMGTGIWVWINIVRAFSLVFLF